MERRKSKSRGIRRLASVKNKSKSSVNDIIDLPTPSYELEDALLSQLQVPDILQNCVLGENPSSWSISNEFGSSNTLKRKQTLVYHRCYNDATFIPLWHTFSVLDAKSTGHALLGRLMSVSKSLITVLGEENTDTALQKHFLNYSQVPFSQYQRYVLDNTTKRNIDAEKLSALCWGHCKQHYLTSPMVDGLDSVVPTELCESLYYLFCIFNKLTEPGTYPPTMDYEETELLLRKLFACLGMSWTSTYEEPPVNDDNEKDEEYEQTSPLQIDFQQLLSIIADLVGIDIVRTSMFHQAVRRLCLIEYQEIGKAGWLTVRKEGNDNWKKRWAVLRGTKLTLYDTVLCQVVKEEASLRGHIQIESLTGMSSHKYRFRIVEKEGFNIIREVEFSTSNSNNAHSWITLLNIFIKIQETGMSAKTAEISERRLERFKRRESMREVYKKKKDLQDTYMRLEEARKRRSDVMNQLSERSRQRKAQADHLEKINKIYERLEAIQYQKRKLCKEERDKKMLKLLNNYEKCVKMGKVIDDSHWKETEESKVLRELTFEKAQLESDLEVLQRTSITLSSELSSIEARPTIRSASLEHASFSSSENLSTTSNDAAHINISEVTI